MAKKQFTKGLDALIGAKQTTGRGPGRPKTSTRIVTKSSQEGTKPGETRATFILDEDLVEKLKAVAYWERLLIKEVVSNALQGFVGQYEDKNGAVKPIPKK